jgi:thiol-disulfide isomerase/thioredoxin
MGGMGGGAGGGGFAFSDPFNLFAQFFSGGGGMGGGGGGMGGGQMGGRAARGGMPSGGGRGMGGMGGGMPGMGGLGGMPGGGGGGRPGGAGGGGSDKIIQLTASRPGPLRPPKDPKAARRLASEAWVVEFMSPQCGHCQRLAPEYARAAQKLAGLVKVAAVDCTQAQSQELCSQAGIKGYPTIRTFRPGSSKGEEYRGERKAAAIEQFALSLLPSNFVTNVAPTESGLASFLAHEASNKAGKAHVILVAPKFSPAYKKLSASFARFIHFGLINTAGGNSAAKLAKARKLLGLSEQSDSKTSLLRVVWTDPATGKEVSHEDYSGPMKLRQLDAWLYKIAKKVKAQGGGDPEEQTGSGSSTGSGKPAAAASKQKDDKKSKKQEQKGKDTAAGESSSKPAASSSGSGNGSSGKGPVQPLNAAMLSALFSSSRSGFTVLLVPPASSGANAAKGAKQLAKKFETLASANAAKKQLRFVSAADMPSQGIKQLRSLLLPAATAPTTQQHPQLLVLKHSSATGGVRVASFDLPVDAAAAPATMSAALEDLLAGNARFDRVELAEEKLKEAVGKIAFK